jgi:hypothetical protein
VPVIKLTKDGMGGVCTIHGIDEKCIQNLRGKLLGKRPFQRYILHHKNYGRKY